MVELPPYDPNAKCPKCGCDDISTHYEENAHHRHTTCPLSSLSEPECCTAEHHHRTCQRCRYLWPEAVPAGALDGRWGARGRRMTADFRMEIGDAFEIKDRGVVVTGIIAAGTINAGDPIWMTLRNPDGTHRVAELQCRGVETFSGRKSPGDRIGALIPAGVELQIIPGSFATGRPAADFVPQEDPR